MSRVALLLFKEMNGNASGKMKKHRKAVLLEQITGIEPAWSAWEAEVLPLNYICVLLF